MTSDWGVRISTINRKLILVLHTQFRRIEDIEALSSGIMVDVLGVSSVSQPVVVVQK